MKNTVLQCCLPFAAMAFSVLSATSCVDERYDLSKIDTEAVILKDVALPVGNLKPVTISEFFNIDGSQAYMISADQNGDLMLAFDSDKCMASSFTVPDFRISFQEEGFEERKLGLRLPDQIAGMSVSQLQQLLPEYMKPMSYEDITGRKAFITKGLTTGEECVLPYYVNDVKEINLESDLNYEFTLDIKDKNGVNINSYGGAMYIEKGFTIDFPDYFTAVKNDKIDGYEMITVGDNKNVIQFTKDVKIAANETIVFDIFVSKAEIPSGFIVDGGVDSEGRKCKKVVIDAKDPANMIQIEGDVYVDPSDFIKIPSVVEMNMKLAFHGLEIKSALASLNIDVTLPDQNMDMPDVPQLLKSEGVVIDLYDPVLTFHVANPSPLDVYLSAELRGYREGQELACMYFGENGTDAPFTVSKEFEGDISFSRRGENGMIANPMIAQLIRTIPDEVRISDVRVASSKDYVEIIPGKEMDFSLDYSFKAPLAFGPDLCMPLEYVIKELELDLEKVGFKSARLAFDVINTIPLALSVDAAVMDGDDKISNDVDIEIDGQIEPGSLDSPSDSKITITLKSYKKGLKIDGLKLMMEANCPSPEYHGKVINKDQGIEIRNLTVALPDGISLDFKEMMEEE